MNKIDNDKLDLVKMIRSILKVPEPTNSCGCRTNSPDTCDKCTDMESGEKLSEQEHPCIDCEGTGMDKEHTWPDGSHASCETCDGYGTLSESKNL